MAAAGADDAEKVQNIDFLVGLNDGNELFNQ